MRSSSGSFRDASRSTSCSTIRPARSADAPGMTDFLILGGGMAGAPAGDFLAEHGGVPLLEKEDAPGYHSTGRSAALFTENYGSPPIPAPGVGTRPFLQAPPRGLAGDP